MNPRIRTALLASSALVALPFIVITTQRPSLADAGAGGGAPSEAGGAGGTGFVGATGGNGQGVISGDAAGGGGGGAAGGGNGGSGGNVGSGAAAGGQGGTAFSPNGQVGSNGSGGGGGGGGFNGNGADAVTITNTSPLTGGNGGGGGNGDGTTSDGGGGGGGAGGYGAVVLGAGASSNSSTITGGTGGAGGSGFGGGAFSGNGGDGGVGVQFTTIGATFTNFGTVTGGNGGAGGSGLSGAAAGTAGAGGAGIVGADLTIINSGTIAGGLSGNGVTRANAITFTGGINLLELQAGSSITGNVVAFSTGDTLRLGGTANASFDASQIGAQYVGFGAFQKAGSSTWTLTGTNAATLSWTINAGTLAVNGSLPNSPVIINAGGILSGTGTVGAVTVNAGGTLAPGNSPGTITVASVTFNAGSTYAVAVTPSTASRTNATGAATLAGTVRATFEAGSYVPRSYTILSAAGGRAGTFDALTTVNLPFLIASLSYTSTDVLLNLSLNPSPDFTGLTENQQAVGNAVVRGIAANGGPGGLSGLLGLGASQLPSALDALSGEVATGVQNPSFLIGEQFLDAMLGQAQRRRGQPCGGGPSAGGGSGGSGRWGAWASGFGTLSGHRDGDAVQGSARLNSSDGGIAAGADMCLGPNLRVGFALGGARSDFSLDGRTANGNTRAVLAGTYGSFASGPFYLDIALAYGHSDFSTTRNVAFNALTERATGDFNGNQGASRIEAGWHFRFRGYSLVPFIGATGQVLQQSGFGENAVNTATGQPGITGLNYQSQTTNAPLPFLGGEASKTFQLGENATITPRLRLSWGYETSVDRQSTSSFQSLSGASFTVNGARPARSGANIRAGVDGDLYGLVEFYAQVDSSLAAGGNGFSAAAGVRMAW